MGVAELVLRIFQSLYQERFRRFGSGMDGRFLHEAISMYCMVVGYSTEVNRKSRRGLDGVVPYGKNVDCTLCPRGLKCDD